MLYTTWMLVINEVCTYLGTCPVQQKEAMEYHLLRFADDTNELGRSLNILKGRTAIHSDLDRLEEWSNRNQQDLTRTNAKPYTGEGITPATTQTEWLKSTCESSHMGRQA